MNLAPTYVSRLLRLGLLLCLVTANAQAQDTATTEAAAMPDLTSLQSSGWEYFEGPASEVAARADEFLAAVENQIPDLAPQNEVPATALLAAVNDNLAAYIALLGDPGFVPRELDPPATVYDLQALLALARQGRDASAAAAEEQFEVDREERILAGATRRRDAAFGAYIDADAGDARWLAGLQLMQARSAQAISERRLAILTERYEQARDYEAAVNDRVELAKQRLATSLDADSFDALIDQVAANAAAVEAANETLREAQLAASGLETDTAAGRSQQRLLQQMMLAAEVDLAAAETALAQSEAKRAWVELQLDMGTDLNQLSDEVLVWREFLRDTNDQMPDWRQATEEELLAVQSVERTDLDSAAQGLLQQRTAVAQDTLTALAALAAATEDLDLIMSAAELAASDRAGAIGSIMTNLKLGAKTVYRRTVDLMDVTLFSIGEAPVTGGDILRMLLIIAAGWLLSRGIRHAIRRVGDEESASIQASLYTVGRLTHYIIIILALFVALSSVGIDFGNLALVAGALSVGIGFGLQSIVNNFVSGLIILFEHTLRVGDYIELDTGLTGTVKSINVRSTLINTNDNIDIVVPNSEFVTTRMTNWTLGERILRVRIPFGVAYGTDKDLIKKAALEAAAEVPYTLTHMKGREPDVWLTEFGDNSLNFLLLVWVNRQGARRPTRTRSAYLWALETKLTEYGIEIPFPQRDLHLRSGWPPVSDTAASDRSPADPSDEPAPSTA